ncbi:hypothetical protein [Leuconostoc citreum]|uniref:hypothetical protein n=1 Tax=Leuconostoc citreum TaxID=33964 RepID=UPI001C1F46A4|nr:hypothetical protein [Leuconostoc citreum]MBU7451534.1 hypothetical protein [Leuconostoc citreum]
MTVKELTTDKLVYIDNSYYKTINSADALVSEAVYNMIKKPKVQYMIKNKAKQVATRFGVSLEETATFIQEQTIVSLLSELSKFPSETQGHIVVSAAYAGGYMFEKSYIGQAIKFAARTVQKIAYSESIRKHVAEHEMAYLSDHKHTLENSRTVAVEEAKNEMAAPLLGTLINRKDQLEFLTSILTVGKEQTKVTYELEEKNFNKKLNRAIETINKNIKKSSEDYAYTKALVNEIIETAINEPLTESEEIEESYYEAVSGY